MLSPPARRLPSTLALALTAVLATTGGCAGTGDDRTSPGGSGTETPYSSSGSSGAAERHRAQCIVSDVEGEIILHPGSLTPASDIVLGEATLAAPVNLEIIESDVVRFTGRSTIQGIIEDYPPLKNAGLADSLADWDQRRPLAGVALTPDDGQQAVLVAVRLQDPAVPGHLTGVVLTSDDGATAYAQPVLVEPHGALCTVAEFDSTLDWVP